MKDTYEVVALDVWGNEQDGWRVNDICKTGKFLTLNEYEIECDGCIVDKLKAIDLLKEHVKPEDLHMDGEPNWMLFISDAKTDEPVYQLHAVNPI